MKNDARVTAGSVLISLAVLMAVAEPAHAAIRTWTGGGADSNWFTSANWTPAAVPAAGDSVVISNANAVVILSNATAFLDTFTITNTATLLFTNYDTNTTIVLQATNVYVRNSARITHSGNTATTTNSLGQWVPDGRVWIVCSNLTVETSGAINADWMGYMGVTNASPDGDVGRVGKGPGGGQRASGPSGSGGGAYGGSGGGLGGGQPYGVPDQPLDPGSGGGGGWTTVGGRGGGLIRLDVGQGLLLNGTISANGQSTTVSGGSGGAIYIVCTTVAATNGVLSANGGNGSNSYGAGGGGGRIAVKYSLMAQSNLNAVAKPSLLCSADRGDSSGSRGRPGTLYFPDSSFFPTPSLRGGQVVVPGLTAWTLGSLVVSNGLNVFSNLTLTITNGLVVSNALAGLELSNSVVQVGTQLAVYSGSFVLSAAPNNAACLSIGADLLVNSGTFTFYAGDGKAAVWGVGSGITVNGGSASVYSSPTSAVTVTVPGSLVVTNGAYFYVYGARTNGVSPGYGALVTVNGETLVAASSWISPVSDPYNGGSPYFRLKNLTLLSTNGGFDASGMGYAGCTNKSPGGDIGTPGFGPGGGWRSTVDGASGGAGYGGRGGGAGGGTNYGLASAPLSPGSGGGGGWTTVGGYGGGLVWIDAAGQATLNGTVRANGGIVTVGAGAGGGIYISCRTLAGTNALIEVKGGKSMSFGCGGGGGRIALWRLFEVATTNTWNWSADPGTPAGSPGALAATGTVFWGQIPPIAGVLIQLR